MGENINHHHFASLLVFISRFTKTEKGNVVMDSKRESRKLTQTACNFFSA